MDIATLLGIVGGLGLIIGSIAMGGGLGGFVDLPSFLIVVGGTVAATLIMFPIGVVIGSFQVALKTFFARTPDPGPLIKQVLALSNIARKDGLIALEKQPVEDPFLKKGVRMLVDGTPPALLRVVLDTEIGSMRQRHRRGQGVFKGMGTAAPAFGMIGTLIGLINMLKSLDDPGAIGPAMAVALLTTLYGAVLSNVIFLPMAKKLEERSNEESFYLEMAREGVTSLQNGDHPMMVQEKLLAYLAPKQRNGNGNGGKAQAAPAQAAAK